MSDAPAEKAALRERLCELRAAISPEARAAASTDVARRTVGILADLPAGIALAYGATPSEVDPAPLVAELRARGWTIAYPRVAGSGELTLHEVADERALVRGSFGLREPAADAPTVDPASVSAVIVPGVGFDERCARIGYGGGYYDRLLPRLTETCVRIGLAFEEQLVDVLPTEDHDVALSAVVTPSRVIRPTSSPA